MGTNALITNVFSLTVLAAVLTFGAAQAAPADKGQIRVAVSAAGLDLHTAAGAAAFDQRVKAAARTVCMESRGIDNDGAADSLLDSCVRQTVKAAMARKS